MNKRISLLSLFVIAACGGGSDETNTAESADLQSALLNTVDEVVVPAISDFAAATAALSAEATVFCETPTESGLTGLQEEWRSMATEWNRAALYNLGPLNQDLIFPRVIFIESMRQRGTDYTDTVRSAIETALAGSGSLDADFFDAQAFTEGGILALEILLFETSDTSSRAPADIATEFSTQERKCAYLDGTAARLDRVAQSVLNGWSADFLESGTSFRDVLVVDRRLDDGMESVPALLVTAFDHLDYVKRRKLEGILDARLAEHFYENLVSTVDELTSFLDGPSYGFFDHMVDRGFSAEVDEVRAAIAVARARVVSEDRMAILDPWGDVEGFLKREIPNGLNVDLGINFTDGD